MWGRVGMFLAVPLTMVGKVLLDNSDEFRWLSVAMSKKKVKKGEVHLSDFDLTLTGEELRINLSAPAPNPYSERHAPPASLGSRNLPVVGRGGIRGGRARGPNARRMPQRNRYNGAHKV